jgi:hypothetical protein
MVGQKEVLKCGSGRERQAASNDRIDWEGVPLKTSPVGNKASVRAGRSGVGGLRRGGQGRAGQGANSVCVRYMCLGGTSNFRKRWDEKRAHSCGVVNGYLSWDSLEGGGGVLKCQARVMFFRSCRLWPHLRERESLGIGIGLDWISKWDWASSGSSGNCAQ